MADEQQAPRQPAGASAELADVARAHVAPHPRAASRADPEAFHAAFDASRLPAAPGCYIMKDAKGKPIYVGKAKSLRARVRSYLNESDTRYTVRFLMRRVGSIDFFVTSNEKEALLLENSLIKSHKPRYNVRLKDDKTYLSLKIDPRQRFPRIIPTRRYKKDGARYFGPYHSASSMRQTLRQLQRLFPLRTCTDHVLNNRTRPCLYYQMKQCVAPCVGYVSREQYDELVQQVMLALDGRNDELEKQLTARIEEHAERLEFEQAAELRDRLYAVRRTLERQRTVGVPGAEDRDVFGLYQRGRYLTVQLIYYRGGKMLGGRTCTFERTELPAEELLGSLLLQYYADAPAVPREVLVSHALEDAETLGELLTELRGTKVQVHQPQRGEKKRLTELAARNARQHFEEQRLADKANQDALEGVQRMLQLPAPPARIECFDISTIQG